MKSVKEVEVDCVIFFLSERQMRWQLRIERTIPPEVEKKQDIAEVKREIRGGVHPLLQDFFVKKIGILYAYDV